MITLNNILLIIVGSWFAISIVAVVFENLFLWIYLKKSGAKMLFIMSGTPGYLDKVYKSWCKENGVSPESRLRRRRILLINVILAVIAFFLFVTFLFEKP